MVFKNTFHSLQYIICVVGMVAEDIDRLEKQMRGESAQWILLSVSNNCLYDVGISKLVQVLRCIGRPSLTSCLVKFRVLLSTTKPNNALAGVFQVLQKTTAPLETLDVSKTFMTSTGARVRTHRKRASLELRAHLLSAHIT